MRVRNQWVKDRVGELGISDESCLDSREVAADERASSACAVVDDFQEIAAFARVARGPSHSRRPPRGTRCRSELRKSPPILRRHGYPILGLEHVEFPAIVLVKDSLTLGLGEKDLVRRDRAQHHVRHRLEPQPSCRDR